MRWLLTIGLCLGFALAQEDNIITFALRLTTPETNIGTKVDDVLRERLSDERFRLLDLVPEGLGEENNKRLSELFGTTITVEDWLLRLGAFAPDNASPCAGWLLGNVATNQPIDEATLRDFLTRLQALATSLGDLEVLGADPQNNTGTDDADNTTSVSATQYLVDIHGDYVTMSDKTKIQGSGVIIAVLDTGVEPVNNFGNTQLIAAMTPMNSSHFDYIGTGISTVSFDSDPEDLYEEYMGGAEFNKGHGTPIARIANLVAPSADILAIRVCDEEGRCPTSRVIAGICHAVHVANDNKKDLVINLSLSGNLAAYFPPQQSLLYEAIDDAVQLAQPTLNDPNNTTFFPYVLVAAEVGNRSLDPKPRYPAAFGVEGLNGVIATASLEKYGTDTWTYVPSWYSTRGNYIDVAAAGHGLFMGEHVVGTHIDGSPYLEGYTGTSFATPWLAGTLALMIETNRQRPATSQLSPWYFEQCLKTTTQPPKPAVVSSQEVGAGMIDTRAAVTCIEMLPNYP
jgi:subtilisin family serine protease